MLTVIQLRKLLTYNSRTGVFRWNVARANTKSGGHIAGAIDHRSMCRLIRVDGRLCPAGRLEWLYMKGDGQRTESTASMVIVPTLDGANLREITRAQQQASTPVRSFLGVKGVWVTRYGKYAAEIRGAGQKTYLGCFATLEEANAAYAKAAKKAFGSFARTR